MKFAVVGSGPAALMFADTLALAGIKVHIFEKRKGAAWKLFVAGSSGLNITNSLPLTPFAERYSEPHEFWEECLKVFGPKEWIQFIEKTLDLGTFLGTSGRYFVETMHAAKLVRNWKRRLESLGVQFLFDHECVDFSSKESRIELNFSSQDSQSFDAVCFALGGASWEAQETPLRWPVLFTKKNIGFRAFTACNSGFELAWTEAFLKEAEGKPLKNISFYSSKGELRGDLIVTSYGLEGTPIYTLGEVGRVFLDLKPDLSEAVILKKLSTVKENLSPLRRINKVLNLGLATKALLFHFAGTDNLENLEKLVRILKRFPLELLRERPLTESISSKGGILWSELDESLMLKKHKNVYCIGEMLNWDAPTGGFLIQGCVSQGFWCAQKILSSKK